jgi:hypothetical protein
MNMETEAQTIAPTPRRERWNKGKLISQKPPLRPKHLWSIRTRLQMDGWTREFAMLAGRLATISFHHHLPRFTGLN